MMDPRAKDQWDLTGDVVMGGEDRWYNNDQAGAARGDLAQPLSMSVLACLPDTFY